MDEQPPKKKSKWRGRGGDSGGFVFFVAWIGALVYYLQQANSFGDGVLGFLKACVWPALLVYKLLESLKM